jgi:hypothetical protein
MYLTDNVMVKHCGQADRFIIVNLLINMISLLSVLIYQM